MRTPSSQLPLLSERLEQILEAEKAAEPPKPAEPAKPLLRVVKAADKAAEDNARQGDLERRRKAAALLTDAAPGAVGLPRMRPVLRKQDGHDCARSPPA